MTAVYENEVALKYHVYNSIFLMLRFEKIRNTGILLPVFAEDCVEGYLQGKDPVKNIESFKARYKQLEDDDALADLLFRFIQYVERQIVLIDAIEEAAFDQMHQLHGQGSLSHWLEHRRQHHQDVVDTIGLRLVLTAHPTQFYPGPVLGIITDLAKAVKREQLGEIRTLLQQLGKTPFFKREKPTPYDEASRLTWYLEHVFYDTLPPIQRQLDAAVSRDAPSSVAPRAVTIGFWPGGDRDGNPFVTTETTLKVADKLRQTLLRCYHQDVRRLKRRLTFHGVAEQMSSLEGQLYQQMLMTSNQTQLSSDELEASIQEIITALHKDHDGLFAEEIEELLIKVRLFGLHFASIDIRQDSRVLQDAMDHLLQRNDTTVTSWQEWFALDLRLESQRSDDPVIHDTLEVCRAIQAIQQQNGESGCHRFIISNCRGPESVAQVYALARAGGMAVPLALDIIPLFETIDDLVVAAEAMDALFSFELYRQHVTQRGDRQVVMLGFSDGTKDGGYVSANWNIYLAKEQITAVARKHGVTAIFFDGRGGPPARGGGNTHQYYASQGETIEQKEIELTVQGQTISSQFGSPAMAQYNTEQLLTAGLDRGEVPHTRITAEQRALIGQLADYSLEAYGDLKQDPVFIDYLEQISPLKYFSMTNIASRPGKRGRSAKLTLDDLRAISFVGAWSLLKQNVPGYYGFGSALARMIEAGREEDLIALYRDVKWFRTLARNSMQSLAKCFFPLTRYIAEDSKFGAFWTRIHDEYELTRRLLLRISGLPELLEDDPINKESIALRERVVLPLLTIQQYGLMRLKEGVSEDMRPALEKMVVRAMYGIINAARNSA